MTTRSLPPVSLLVLLLAATGCGSWGRVGDDQVKPQPGEVLSQALDLGAAFRKVGRLSAAQPLPFVADVGIFAGPGDSGLAVIGVSLENRNLAFKRENDQFVARYRVQLSARPAGGGDSVSLTRDQVVRVATFPETQRAEESVLFQEGLTLAPGDWMIGVRITDPDVNHSTSAERAYVVPSFAPGSLSAPQLAYQVRARGTRSSPMSIILNPRGMLAYGGDSANIYVEGYRMDGPRVVPIRILDQFDSTLVIDSLRFDGKSEVESQVFRYSADNAPLGIIRIIAGTGADTVSSGALVSFSQNWVVTNFDEMLSVLRYFPQSPALDSLRKSKTGDRALLWRSFWKSTDPAPGTPAHEALDAYFRRVAIANLRFRDEGVQGWRTDRGEVLIRLGEPDEVSQATPGNQRTSVIGGMIRWGYTQYQLALFFYDEAGFGRYRLDTGSRSEFEQVVSRLERQAAQ
jgi:GWxTD domain-containing protein